MGRSTATAFGQGIHPRRRQHPCIMLIIVPSSGAGNGGRRALPDGHWGPLLAPGGARSVPTGFAHSHGFHRCLDVTHRARFRRSLSCRIMRPPVARKAKTHAPLVGALAADYRAARADAGTSQSWIDNIALDQPLGGRPGLRWKRSPGSSKVGPRGVPVTGGTQRTEKGARCPRRGAAAYRNASPVQGWGRGWSYGLGPPAPWPCGFSSPPRFFPCCRRLA